MLKSKHFGNVFRKDRQPETFQNKDWGWLKKIKKFFFENSIRILYFFIEEYFLLEILFEFFKLLSYFTNNGCLKLW